MGKTLFFIPNSWQLDGLGDFASVPRGKTGKKRQYNVRLTLVHIIPLDKEGNVGDAFIRVSVSFWITFPPQICLGHDMTMSDEDPRNST